LNRGKKGGKGETRRPKSLGLGGEKKRGGFCYTKEVGVKN